MSSYRPLSSEEVKKVWAFHQNDLTDGQHKALHQMGLLHGFFVKALETPEPTSLTKLASQYMEDNPYPQAPPGTDW
jgi:hypothetical protein